MATPIYRGSSDVKLQKQVFTWDSTKGGDYSEVWQALDASKAATFYNGKVYTCRSASLTVTNGTAEMELKWGAAGNGSGPGAANSLEVTNDRWECPEPKTQKPIFEHPSFISALYTLASYASASFNDTFLADAINAWRKAAAANQQFTDFSSQLKIGNTTIYAAGWASFVAANPATAGLLIRSYRLASNDQTHYQASQYSVRHTTNTPNYWSLNRADRNVNCIYTPAQFVTEATDSSLWYYPMPGRIQYKIAAAVANLISITPSRTNYQIGWLKAGSAETSIHGGRVEIQTDYVLDQWSTDLYAVAT